MSFCHFELLVLVYNNNVCQNVVLKSVRKVIIQFRGVVVVSLFAQGKSESISMVYSAQKLFRFMFIVLPVHKRPHVPVKMFLTQYPVSYLGMRNLQVFPFILLHKQTNSIT